LIHRVSLIVFFVAANFISSILAASEIVTAESKTNKEADSGFEYEIKITGAKRSSPNWIKSYLSLDGLKAEKFSDEKVKLFEDKLMTTGIFKSVSIRFRTKTGIENADTQIDLEEKWTIIPVVRGEFGGGPLFALLEFTTLMSLAVFGH